MHFFHHYNVFFYADYGILYEELLVRAKKTQVVLHMLYMIYVHVHTYIYIRVNCAFNYDDLFQ